MVFALFIGIYETEDISGISGISIIEGIYGI